LRQSAGSDWVPLLSCNELPACFRRALARVSTGGQEQDTGRAEMDFADWWDKWPGQYDPFMSPLETYRAAYALWREVIDQRAPRMVIRSNMQPVNYSYGIVDICRVLNGPTSSSLTGQTSGLPQGQLMHGINRGTWLTELRVCAFGNHA
jgi:hypothetical protein